MHVHVDSAWIEIEKQKRDRELPFHQRSVIALAQGDREHGVFDSAPVHEHELLGAGLPAHSRLPNQPADPQFRIVPLHNREKPVNQIFAVKITNPIQQTRRGR